MASKKEMFDFVEWVGTYFLKLHGTWVRNYSDQRDQKNWQTTEDLYKFWLKNIKNK